MIFVRRQLGTEIKDVDGNNGEEDEHATRWANCLRGMMWSGIHLVVVLGELLKLVKFRWSSRFIFGTWSRAEVKVHPGGPQAFD